MAVSLLEPPIKGAPPPHWQPQRTSEQYNGTPGTSRLRISQRNIAIVDDDEEEGFEVVRVPKSDEALAKIAEATAGNTLFIGVSPEQQHTIFMAMRSQQVEAGETIINQGEQGDMYYVIESGEYEVFLKAKGDTPVHRYAGNGAFGELALLYKCPRASTVRCAVGGSLWTLDRRTFRHVLMAANRSEADQTARFLKAVEILSPLDDAERSLLASVLEEVTFEDGEILWEIGDDANWLCLIKEGSAVSTAEYREPLNCGIGMFFGTQALKEDGTKRLAKVVATGHVKAFKLTRAMLEGQIGNLGQLIKHHINAKLLPVIELFAALSGAEIEVLVDSSTDVVFEAGEQIIERGSTGTSMFVIKEGTADMLREGGDGPVMATVGEAFGEDAFMGESGGQPHRTTVVARERLTCLEVDCKRFKSSTTAQLNAALRSSGKHRSKTMPQFHDLQQTRLLGVGSFGRVRLAYHPTSDQFFALKCMNKGLIIQRKQVAHVRSEKELLAACDHPFLVNLCGWYQDATELYMLCELIQGGEMFNILSKPIFNEDNCRFYTANVTAAFEYLHDRHIAYRDLKPENLLLDEKGYLKVADFGFAKVVTERTWTLCGTPDYLAPEIITCKGHGLAVDWWAVGIFLHELLTGWPPFSGDEEVDTFKNILSGRFDMPPEVSGSAASLLKGLLTVNPAHRLGSRQHSGSREVREHPFFEKLDFVSLVSRQLPAPYVPVINDPSDMNNFDEYDEPDPAGLPKHNTDDVDTFGFWDLPPTQLS